MKRGGGIKSILKRRNLIKEGTEVEWKNKEKWE